MDKLMAILPKEKIGKLKAIKNMQEQFLTQEPKITEWNGFRFPPGLSADCMEYAYESWDMPKNSVFLHSFPKTGTNWALEVIRRIVYGHDEKILKLCKDLPMPLFVLEMGIDAKYDLLPHLPLNRLCFASHAHEKAFNYEKMKAKKGKAIYLLRNPRDQAVSWYHFSKKVPLFKKSDTAGIFDLKWNDFFEAYLKGEQPTSCRRGEGYAEHIKSWLEHRDDGNCIFVFYEDMKKDFAKEVIRIATFLDVKISEERVAEIEDKCSFANMKKDFDVDKMEIRKYITRKGVIGDWKNEFSEAQVERMDQHFKKVLGDSVKFTYE